MSIEKKKKLIMQKKGGWQLKQQQIWKKNKHTPNGPGVDSCQIFQQHLEDHKHHVQQTQKLWIFLQASNKKNQFLFKQSPRTLIMGAHINVYHNPSERFSIKLISYPLLEPQINANPNSPKKKNLIQNPWTPFKTHESHLQPNSPTHYFTNCMDGTRLIISPHRLDWQVN